MELRFAHWKDGGRFCDDAVEGRAHLCIDMQRVFSKGGVWKTPWMEPVWPVVAEIAARYKERTVFTRFITPQTTPYRPGRWQRYYQRSR